MRDLCQVIKETPTSSVSILELQDGIQLTVADESDARWAELNIEEIKTLRNLLTKNLRRLKYGSLAEAVKSAG